jgi:chitin disaccharide deacetylase
MRYLIVNADDFGLSRGINRGILDAHRQGILTSASLMVSAPWSDDAARLSRTAPELSVGLHAHLLSASTRNSGWPQSARSELRAQFNRFSQITGAPPTHLDSHHNTHRNPELLPVFLEFASEYDVPLRAYSRIRYYSDFYGQWGGEMHLEQISPANLLRILRTEVGPGVTELSCHPGYVDPDLASGYSLEREAELLALCDPGLRRALEKEKIELVSYQELRKAGIDLGASAGARRQSVG